jgi:HEAT repeat protein
LLTRYISGENVHQELERAAKESRKDLEQCIATALLRLRGTALERLRELPAVIELRNRWIARSRKGDDAERRYAVEQIGVVGDPAAIPALEKALQDPVGAVQAAAIRGLLNLRAYGKRDELIHSLPQRTYLVQVLTACESAATKSRSVMPGLRQLPVQGACPVDVESLLGLARAIGAAESAEAARANCLVLAARGTVGLDSLRSLSAAGKAGDAPAEAYGASLAAAARGGRT